MKLKSIAAVLAGFITVVVLSIGTDTVLEYAGVFPPVGTGLTLNTTMLAVALLYRSVFTVAGGYVTALLAPQNPMKHVTILGVIGTIAGTAGVYVGWELSAHWYPIALAVLAFPSTYLGGKLRTRNSVATRN